MTKVSRTQMKFLTLSIVVIFSIIAQPSRSVPQNCAKGDITSDRCQFCFKSYGAVLYDSCAKRPDFDHCLLFRNTWGETRCKMCENGYRMARNGECRQQSVDIPNCVAAYGSYHLNDMKCDLCVNGVPNWYPNPEDLNSFCIQKEQLSQEMAQLWVPHCNLVGSAIFQDRVLQSYKCVRCEEGYALTEDQTCVPVQHNCINDMGGSNYCVCNYYDGYQLIEKEGNNYCGKVQSVEVPAEKLRI